MLYNYIKDHYKEAEPIFFSDLLGENITEHELNATNEMKAIFNSTVGPNADMVARYRFISKGDNVDGFYACNS